MEDGGTGGGGADGLGGSWFGRRGSNKRNFSTMSASHRDDSPDSLFLSQHSHDPHYDNEHSSRRRRVEAQPQGGYEQRGREMGSHYPGDGLDFRRPVMSAPGRGEEVGRGNAGGNMGGSALGALPAVIDLTEDNDNDVGSESSMGWRGDGELGGASDVATVGSSSHTGGAGQRLPRFGRDLVDAGEQDDDFQLHSFETAPANDAGMLGALPGASYLALPPRRSASGRVQYSTLRRPARQPSPPRDMDDGGIEYMGTRSFANVQERRPTPGPAVTNNVPRSVTPYPANLNNTIDLTDEPDDLDDDVLFVNERRAPGGVNLEQPNANAGAQTRNGDQGGFGIGRLANILRDGGAALGGRLAQRVHDFNHNRYANMTNDELEARRVELEEATTRARRERQERHDRVRRELEARRHNRAMAAEIRNPRRNGGHIRIPRVRVDPDGNIPGFERVGWFPFNGGVGARNNDGGGGAAPAGLGNMANMMDYQLAAFDLGVGGGRERQPTPKYEPPAEPEAGFTRNPGEDEVVVCPNCGDELGVGVESEAKGEIWVNKGCGHAYCGDCAQHRSKSKSKKGKGRAVDAENLPPPFKHCVVEGCGKSTGGKNMVRVYFGT